MIHILQTPKATLKLDFANFYHSLSRDATRQILVEDFPERIVFLDQLYPPEGNQVFVQQAAGDWDHFWQIEGFTQGDPLAPLFSYLPLLIHWRQINWRM
jgi:hypothetical protein